MRFWHGKTKWMVMVALAAALMLALSACAPPEEPDEEPEPEEPEVDETVEILMVDWECATASSHVAGAVLEEEMGYDVEITSVDAGVMWSGLAEGDADFINCAWLPMTHEAYVEDYGDQTDEVSTHYDGARIGAVVPAYMDIDSVEEIPEVVDEIIGIDPGAGIMSATEEAIDVYDLDVDLIEGSDAAMTAELMSAVEDEEPIVVTGWTPHWKFAEWDLKFLEDPELVYGEEEYIGNIARENLQEDMPDVYEFLENYYMTDDQIGEVMAMNADDPDFEGNARQFIEDNPDLVEDWLP